MNCWLFPKERLVHEVDGWGVIIDDDQQRVYGTHQACAVAYSGSGSDSSSGISKEDEDDGKEVYGSLSWEAWIDTPAVCCNCEAGVPEGVQGLIIMLGWDLVRR